MNLNPPGEVHFYEMNSCVKLEKSDLDKNGLLIRVAILDTCGKW